MQFESLLDERVLIVKDRGFLRAIGVHQEQHVRTLLLTGVDTHELGR